MICKRIKRQAISESGIFNTQSGIIPLGELPCVLLPLLLNGSLRVYRHIFTKK
jgi:hypothetical protein